MKLQIIGLFIMFIITMNIGYDKYVLIHTKESSSTTNTSPKVGEIAPDFTLEDQDSRKVTLSEAYSNKPTILVFYRGYW